MTTGIRWGWRVFWALAACVWLAVLPAVAMDAAHDVDSAIGSWRTHLTVVAVLLDAHEKGGPA
jgi:hypothetical protein